MAIKKPRSFLKIRGFWSPVHCSLQCCVRDGMWKTVTLYRDSLAPFAFKIQPTDTIFYCTEFGKHKIQILQEKLGAQGMVNDIAIRLEQDADESTVVERTRRGLP